jgi:membrane protease YdiL (CAAX protease family)
VLNLNADKSSAVLLSIFVLVAFGLLNGLYKETLNVLSPPAFWAVDVLRFVIVPVAVVAALWRYGNTSPKEYGLGSRFGGMPPKKLFALTCVIALVLYLVYVPVNWVGRQLWWPQTPSFTYHDVIPEALAPRVLVVIYFSLTAAFVEEIAYRGLPWLYVSRHFRSPSVWWYALVSSFFFGLIHYENGFHEVVATFVFGLVACHIYVKLRNLWPLVGAHLIIDLLTFW